MPFAADLAPSRLSDHLRATCGLPPAAGIRAPKSAFALISSALPRRNRPSWWCRRRTARDPKLPVVLPLSAIGRSQPGDPGSAPKAKQARALRVLDLWLACHTQVEIAAPAVLIRPAARRFDAPGHGRAPHPRNSSGRHGSRSQRRDWRSVSAPAPPDSLGCRSRGGRHAIRCVSWLVSARGSSGLRGLKREGQAHQQADTKER